MAREPRLICASGDLEEGGKGVRFRVWIGGVEHSAFAVRHGGAVRAYVNRCPHMGTELDWEPGEFFEETRLYLVCATHGALFQPVDGHCIAGPCRGASLTTIEVVERGGHVQLPIDDPGEEPAP